MMITFVVMLVSVLVIFKATNYFGLQLKFKPLLLCAFCAFAVNIITLSVSSYLTFSHLIFIFSAVLISACAVTFYNEKLTLRSESGELHKCNSIGITAIESPQPTKTAFVERSSPLTETNPPPIIPFAFVNLTVAEPDLNQYITETPDELVAVEWSQVDEGLSSKVPITPDILAKTTYNLPALIPVTMQEQIKANIEKCKLAELETSLQKLTSLDALLDYAYAQNTQHNYSIAIAAFQKTLHKYSSDSYAPFIIIELGNIYKSIGSYDEALAIYAKAFTLPTVLVDNVVKENFQMNIDYLRIIKVILNKHNCFKTPFSQIPQTIVQEIEMTFQEEQQKHRHYNN
jgi:colicin import membrane protein